MASSPLVLPTPTPPSESPNDSTSVGESGSAKTNTAASASTAVPGDQSRPAHRVSLACLQCRSRHLKCDAAKPRCNRCAVDGVSCTYAQSRRRGNRRTRLPMESFAVETPAPATSEKSLPSPVSSAATVAQNGPGPMDVSTSDYFSVDSIHIPGINEHLISLYYNYFHRDHPCALPRWALVQRCTTDPEPLMPVLLTMQYIGSLFDPSIPSQPLKEAAQNSLPILPQPRVCTCPYQLQAMLLFGIAIYWCDEIEQGLELLRHVVFNALELKMHLEPFAPQNSHGDRVLEESWRRTWWTVYVTDGNIAGSTHSFPTHVTHVELSATLPCEEEEYESGEIPTPRTLDDFDIREFLPEGDPGFSSFAQLVGLTRTLDMVLSRNFPFDNNLRDICSQVDISLSAWCSLLPPSKRQCLTSKGEIDMQLFKANMLINTYVVDLHRQLSDLAYSPIESVARCGPPGPSQKVLHTDHETRRLHTAKALLGIRRMGDLLPLPVNISTHTPFLICMIANTLVAHLSACRYVFQGHALQLERERVRSCMGALRVLGEHWPLGKRTYREMGIIAREILSLTEKDIPRLQHRQETTPPAVSSSSDQISTMPLDIPAAAFFDFNNLSQDMFGSCDSFTSLTDVCL